MVFKKGYIPWNKGIHVKCGDDDTYRFKKGHQINKGRIPWHKGKKIWSNTQKLEISRRVREAIKSGKKSKINSGSFNNRIYKGKLHWNWKGGKTPLIELIRKSKEYNEWRKQVYKRDNYTCKECGTCLSRNMEAHHKKQLIDIIIENNIITLDEARACPLIWDINNGLTLCISCHNKTRGRHMCQ